MTKQYEDQLKKKQVKTKNTLETMHIFFFKGNLITSLLREKRKYKKSPFASLMVIICYNDIIIFLLCK